MGELVEKETALVEFIGHTLEAATCRGDGEGDGYYRLTFKDPISGTDREIILKSVSKDE